MFVIIVDHVDENIMNQIDRAYQKNNNHKFDHVNGDDTVGLYLAVDFVLIYSFNFFNGFDAFVDEIDE